MGFFFMETYLAARDTTNDSVVNIVCILLFLVLPIRTFPSAVPKISGPSVNQINAVTAAEGRNLLHITFFSPLETNSLDIFS